MTPDEWAASNRIYGETTGMPGPRDPTITPYMIPFVRGVHEGRYSRVVSVTSAQSGKALALDTLLPTPNGWTTMGEVKAGDELFDENGKPCKVVALSQIMHGHDCYKVNFSDGTHIVADAEHLWAVQRAGSKYSKKVHIKTTLEIAGDKGATMLSGKVRSKWAIPVAGALQTKDEQLLIKPYVLGLWLGDGSSENGIISCGDQDIAEISEQLIAEGVEVDLKRERTSWRILMNPYQYNNSTHCRGYADKNSYGRALYHHKKHGTPMNEPIERRATMRSQLSELGVISNKHIPRKYLRASYAQRLALLQGLMDSDGTCNANRGACEFCVCSEKLADGVLELIRSLGFKPVMRVSDAVLNGRKVGTRYRIQFMPYSNSKVFRLKRKLANMRDILDPRSRPTETNRRFIISVERVESVPVKCVAIDTPTHLYLAGEAMIPTHNTEAMLDLIGARLDQRPAPILYVGPTKDFVSQQFEPRLMQLLNEAKSLKAKVLRGKRMRQTLKYVAGVSVRLAHAGSSSALKSDAAAVALVDEFDEMSANIKGQGDPLGLVEARGETYADFVTAIVSTTSQGIADTAIDPESGLEFWQVGDADQVESPIWRLWQEGTRHHWAWPCPHCDEFFIPRFKHLSWPKNASPARALREAWLSCPNCGGVIVDDDKPEMNRRGVMVAPGQKIIDGVVIGDVAENTTLSFWTSGLASPFVTWGKRADSYLKALLSGEPDKIQTTINAGFGEMYAPGANTGDTPDWQAVMKHAMPYKTREMPLGVIRLVCGVDVQKQSLIYTIRGFGGRGTSWLIEAGVLYGSTDEDEVWEALEDLLLTPIGGLHIEKTLIDSGFRPDKPENGSEHRVYAFCRKWKQLCLPTKGRATGIQPYIVSKIEVKPTGKKAIYSINLVHVNTDFFKQLVHSRLQTPLDRPGAFYLPSDVTEDYCKQLVSEVRVTNRGKKPVWVLRSKHNHFLDTEALCAVAGYILNVQRIPEGITRDAAFNDDQNIHDVEDEIVEIKSTDVEPIKQNSVRDRFKGISSRLNR